MFDDAVDNDELLPVVDFAEARPNIIRECAAAAAEFGSVPGNVKFVADGKFNADFGISNGVAVVADVAEDDGENCAVVGNNVECCIAL